MIMHKRNFTYPSNDNRTEIYAKMWIPEGKPSAILQISHGMVEYIDRYDDFASYLAQRGILVVGNDHLGHGRSVHSRKDLGFFEEKNGNRVLLKDIHRLRTLTQRKYPGVPYYMLGHSMGSFLMRQYLCLHGEGLSGAVIMGTGYQPRLVTQFGMLVCKMMAKVTGWRHRSPLVTALAFGSNNKKFGKAGGSQWLSKDKEIVKKYRNDPLCTFKFTLNGYYNLFYSIYTLSFPNLLQRMPKDLPVFFVSGDDDPVGQYGKGVIKVYEEFESLGMENIRCKLYPDDRHEILNELDRQEVYEDIYHWIKEQ